MGETVRVFSGNGARAAVRELCARFERASGHTVTLAFEVNPAVARRITQGEAFDVAIVNPPVLDALIIAGKILAASRTDIGRAGIGMGIRVGMPKPDIASVAAFKHVLLEATSVAFPGEGASGRYFVDLVDRLGLTAQMQAKLRPMPAEDTVEVVARGEADFVVVVASRIAGVPGVDLVGPIPAALQTRIGFAAGVSVAARAPDVAADLVRFLAAPAARPILEAFGIQPAGQ